MTIFFAPLRLPPRSTEKQESIVRLLLDLTPLQWAFFFVGWLAWTCDAIDFFSVSLSVPALSKQFERDTTHITQAITLTLLFRSVGAVLFGVFSDRFGRKWPLVFNLMLVAVLELGAGFVNTFREFLALRSLFGIGMGGIWGLAASTALENLPVGLRGIASGFLQQGYAVGYLLAAVISLELVPEVRPGWRALFWTGAGISAFGALLRAVLPESAAFEKARNAAEAHGFVSEKEKTRIFLHETKEMLKKHWLLCIYSVLLMTGFNFLSHGSQDLYPTYLQKTKGFSAHSATIATIIGNCGAVSGGVVAGFFSQYLGRRITIVACVLLTAVFIPLWIIPNDFHGLAAGAFCVQFGVQGAWGVIPIHLTEMAPPAFRATFPGVAYQLGNMVSSASAQIEATGGAHLKTTHDGKEVPDYAKVQGIFIGVIAAFVIFITVIGPENHSSSFELHKAAFDAGGGSDEAYIDDAVPARHADLEASDNEKATEERLSTDNEKEAQQ
ncbi:MFS domain-containing protein [Mycena indigotica]|uniref:MFS domain-containing protein n=1 Tax=Mycena indigotica TaxID=2126181 RepID=A0A8H6S4P7_9AGAR|nr:MFS domain-containing protein [Mycena indigotica]KAF7292708.1 MFS domain-containing protein [Mycena indigotica]